MRKAIPMRQIALDFESEMAATEAEAVFIYSAIVTHFHGKTETVYEDTIISLVGTHGLELLREFRLIESCAILEGRRLYAL